MLYSTGTLPNLLKICEGGSGSGRFLLPRPFVLTWDDENQRFYAQGSGTKGHSPLRFHIAVMSATFLNHVIFLGYHLAEMKVVERTLFIRVLVPYVIFSIATLRLQWAHGQYFSNIFNEFLKFERKYHVQGELDGTKNSTITGGKTMQSVLKNVKYFRLVSVSMAVISATFSPQLPFNPLSSLSPLWLPNGSHIVQLVGRGVTLISAFTFWSTSADLLFFGFLIHFILPMYCFKWLVQEFKEHVFRLDFHMYREIQWLVLFYNLIHRLYFIGVLTWTLIISLIATSYVLLTQLEHLSGSSFGSVFEGFTACILLIVIGMRSAAFVNSTSIEAKFWGRQALGMRKTRTLEREGKLKGNVGIKYLAKFWRSCPELKIQLFLSNFFDRLTPLKMLDFCFCFVLNMALSKKDK